MEVGKLIVNAVMNKAHITVSVKPFGCMPSSGVSDGVQSLITTRFPGSIFCAVETSGDGATNFYSRIQMYMFKARIAAEEELARAYQAAGITPEQARAFLDANPRYASALHHPGHTVAGTAANLVHEIAPLIKFSKAQRALAAAMVAGSSVVEMVKSIPAKTAKAAAFVSDPDTLDRLRADAELLRDLARGKVAEHMGPLVQRLAGKAYFENNAEVAHVIHEDAIAAE